MLLPTEVNRPEPPCVNKSVRIDTEVHPGVDLFSARVRARARDLHRLAYLIVHDWHAADDVVQVATVRVFQRLGHLRDPEALDSYLQAAVVRTAINWRRRSVREQPTYPLPDATANERQDDRVLRDLVWSSIVRLPAKQRACVALYYYEDQSVGEVAVLLDVSAGSVKRHLHRARTRLEADLRAAGIDTADWE